LKGGVGHVYRVDRFCDDVFMTEAAVSLRSPRRRRSVEERRLIVEETLEAGSSVAGVAMKRGVNANQVFKWRRLHEAGRLGPRAAREVQLLPVRIAEEQEASRPEDADAAPAASAGSIHIELPSNVRISLEGQVDPAMARVCSRVCARDRASGRNTDLDRGWCDRHASWRVT
jgi:transposase